MHRVHHELCTTGGPREGAVGAIEQQRLFEALTTPFSSHQEEVIYCQKQGDHVKVSWGQLSSRGFLRRLLPHFPPTKKKSFIVKNKDLVINAQNPYGSNASYPRPLPSGVHMPKQHSLSGYTSCA